MNTEEVIFAQEEEDKDQEVKSESDQEKLLDEISDIVVSGSDWTTATILDQIERGNIQLNPKFQRRDAWNITRKSRFIESLMLGFSVPQIVLATSKKEKGKFIVIDGKQRLLTILQFYGKSETANNYFTLKGLEFRTKLNGSTYKKLKENLYLTTELNALDNQTIRTILIRNWNQEKLLYKIFLRLNVENTPLSPQELRQALHPGDFIDFLDDRSMESKALRRIFKSSEPDTRMRDVELLLRYLGFHYFLSQYRGNLKDFLDMTCDRLNKNWQKDQVDIEKITSQFELAVEATIDIFDDNFSRMWLGEANRYSSQFNRAILDVMIFYFSDDKIRKAAVEKKTEVEQTFKQLCTSNDEFVKSLEKTTNNIHQTYHRLRLWGEALASILEKISFKLPELIDHKIYFAGFKVVFT